MQVLPQPVLREMGDYEVCLADVQRAYRRLRDASPRDREEAKRAHDAALQRARVLGRKLSADLRSAAAAAR